MGQGGGFSPFLALPASLRGVKIALANRTKNRESMQDRVLRIQVMFTRILKLNVYYDFSF
jgi:hypothetical protein